MNHRNPPVADGQRSTVPTAFLTKTYQLVDDHCVDHIISWTTDGSTFVVWRPGDFAQELLPHKFKHNFTSFIRQINSYGFRKISQDRWEFAHEFFRRGEEHLLGRIDRRRRSSGAASTSSDNEPVLTSDSKTELMEENELLKREIARLTSENEQMKSLCDRIRRLVLNSGPDSGGGEGRTLEEEVAAAAISGREGSQNTEAQLGSRRALQEKGIWLEDSEIQPSSEEELSLQLSLSHVPRKRACGE